MKRATADDLPRIVAMAGRFHAMAGQRSPFDAEATAGFIGRLIEGGGVFVTDGGMIGGALCPSWCCPSYTMAIELFWWAEDGRGLELLAEFENWARESGADEVRMSTLSHEPKAATILRRRGYSPAEVSHSKGV